MRVSEIRVKRIRVNQGLGVLFMRLDHQTNFPKITLEVIENHVKLFIY